VPGLLSIRKRRLAQAREDSASYSEFGSFQELYDQNEAVLHDILTTSMERVKSGQYPPGTGDWNVGTFYATSMDTAAIESAGSEWWTKDDVARYEAEAQKIVRQFDSYTTIDTTTHLQGSSRWARITATSEGSLSRARQ